MIVDKILGQARFYGVEVRLNAAGDGLLLEVDDDPPESLLAALRTAKPDLLALAARYTLDESGALTSGDDLLAELAQLGFRVRHYGAQAALDDDSGQDRVPAMPLIYRFADKQIEYGFLLRSLNAPDCLARGHSNASDRLAETEPEPEPDIARLYGERVKLLARDVRADEARARAYEYLVRQYQAHHSVDLEAAKAAVLDAIAAKGKQP